VLSRFTAAPGTQSIAPYTHLKVLSLSACGRGAGQRGDWFRFRGEDVKVAAVAWGCDQTNLECSLQNSGKIDLPSREKIPFLKSSNVFCSRVLTLGSPAFHALGFISTALARSAPVHIF